MWNVNCWPMLIPSIILLIYSIRYKKESIRFVASIITILASLAFIFFPIMDYSAYPGPVDNLFLSVMWQMLIFLFLFFAMVVVPIIIFRMIMKEMSFISFKKYGLKRENIRLSILYFLICSLLILYVDVTILLGNTYRISTAYYPIGGIQLFLLTFNEEFLFRGILFILLSSYFDYRIAILISISTFALAHPQYYGLFDMLIPIIVGAITVFICIKSKNNLFGAWFFHGLFNINVFIIMPILMHLYPL